MKNKLPLLLIFIVFFSSFSGLNAQNFLKKIDKNNVSIKETNILEKKNFPAKYDLVSLDLKNFKTFLKSKSKNTKRVIQLPNTKGGFSNFEIKETSNFEKELAAKYSMIKSYSAQGIDDPTAVAKISMGTDGFHAVIFSGVENTLYVDPYSKDGKELIVYKRNDLGLSKDSFVCEVEASSKRSIAEGKSVNNANDGKLRTFRLALACTGEYAQFQLTNQGVVSSATDEEKKAAVLSAMNTSMTRVNGLYERDLSVRLILVANNDKIIFLDSTTDNLTNDSADSLINESQRVCDTEIGNENYDIGHTFSTGAGGLAGGGVVCITGSKGRGVTGTDNPVGDPFDVDFVAHEIGHQFGANHTFNGTTNNCSGRNRNNATAVEPGSGTTIMAYAGICGVQNVQDHSDDHFHSVSIAEMWNTIQSSASCAVLTDTNNSAPTINAILNYSIPKSTPFVLKGTANDADGTASLTYNWEQIDNEVGFSIPPVATSSGGAMFRSLPSKISPNRFMPDLATIVAGETSSTWEVLPSVARDLNFSFLVRDNHAGGGSTAREDVTVTVADADAFTVTLPNTAVDWGVGTSQSITWNKGTSDITPISCKNVNIKLSIDGGITFPISLKVNTPNDGVEDIIIPNNVTTTARILVEAADNIFYNVNSTNFTISTIVPTFIITSKNETETVCTPSSTSVVYNFDFEYLNGFTEPVTLTATGNPSGSSVTFNPSTISSASGEKTTFTMTVSNLVNIPISNHVINVKGTSATVNRSLDVTLKVYLDEFTSIELISPEDVVTDITLKPTFNWEENLNASSYIVEIADNINFINAIISPELTSNTYTVSSKLNSNTTYYWRVKGQNLCGEDYSDIRSFTTEFCSVCVSTALNSGDTGTTLVQFNTINNATSKSGGYSDFTNIITEVKRGETHQLTINVNTGGIKRSQTKVWIDWNRDCDFSGVGEEYDLGSVVDKTDAATTLSPLVITVPDDAVFGNIVMRVSTRDTSPFNIEYPTSCENGFLGEVEDYVITVTDNTASVKDFSFEGFNLYPNPTRGEFTLNLKTLSTSKVSVQLFDVSGRLIAKKEYVNTTTNFSERMSFEKASAGLYLLKVTNGNKQTTRKLIIK